MLIPISYLSGKAKRNRPFAESKSLLYEPNSPPDNTTEIPPDDPVDDLPVDDLPDDPDDDLPEDPVEDVPDDPADDSLDDDTIVQESVFVILAPQKLEFP